LINYSFILLNINMNQITIPSKFIFSSYNNLLSYQWGHSWSDNIWFKKKHVLFVVFICKYVFDNFCVLWHIIPCSCKYTRVGSTWFYIRPMSISGTHRVYFGYFQKVEPKPYFYHPFKFIALFRNDQFNECHIFKNGHLNFS